MIKYQTITLGIILILCLMAFPTWALELTDAMGMNTGNRAVYQQSITDFDGNEQEPTETQLYVLETANKDGIICNWCEITYSDEDGETVNVVKGLVDPSGYVRECVFQTSGEQAEYYTNNKKISTKEKEWTEISRSNETINTKAGSFNCEYIISTRTAEMSTSSGNLTMTVTSEYTRERWIANEGDFKGIVRETMTSHMIKKMKHKLDPERTYPFMAEDKTKSETLELKEFHTTGAVSNIIGTPIDIGDISDIKPIDLK